MADLLGVAIGGLIGVSGAVIGPLILEWRKQLYARQDKRAEKYQEFVATLYEHDRWLQDFRRIAIEQSNESVPVPPIGKLEAIKQIYFRELTGVLSGVITDAAVLANSIAEKREKSRRENRPLSTEEETELYNLGLSYHRSFVSCIAELDEYARREFPYKRAHILTSGHDYPPNSQSRL
jgi:hypothetical protein